MYVQLLKVKIGLETDAYLKLVLMEHSVLLGWGNHPLQIQLKSNTHQGSKRENKKLCHTAIALTMSPTSPVSEKAHLNYLWPVMAECLEHSCSSW